MFICLENFGKDTTFSDMLLAFLFLIINDEKRATS
jgi:hypothetical protein